MFQVSVEETFSAGHALRGYKGKCENVHGHNYRVRVTLEGPQLDYVGLLVDFTHLKKIIRAVTGTLDHQFMNDLDPFKVVNPSAENVAKYFYDQVTSQLTDLPPGARVTATVAVSAAGDGVSIDRSPGSTRSSAVTDRDCQADGAALSERRDPQR